MHITLTISANVNKHTKFIVYKEQKLLFANVCMNVTKHRS